MSSATLQDRMAEHRLRLPEAELPAFAEMVADADRMAAWIRAQPLDFADEPATCFAAPRG